MKRPGWDTVGQDWLGPKDRQLVAPSVRTGSKYGRYCLSAEGAPRFSAGPSGLG